MWNIERCKEWPGGRYGITVFDKELSWQMRRYMERENLTVTQLAQRCGLSRYTIKKALETAVGILYLGRICDTIGLRFPDSFAPPDSPLYREYYEAMRDYNEAKSTGDTDAQARAFAMMLELESQYPTDAQRWRFWAEINLEGQPIPKEHDE